MSEPCKTCKHYSLLNGFCKLEGVNRDPNYDKCYKHKELSSKCNNCTNDECDGNCNCNGDCSDKDNNDESKSCNNLSCGDCPTLKITLSDGSIGYLKDWGYYYIKKVI